MSFDKKVRLGDIYQEYTKSKFQVQHADNSGLFPFYTSGDKILTHSEFNVNDEIIFLATGGKANVKYNLGKAAYSTDTYAIKGRDHNSKYLYYFIQNELSYIERNFFSGSGLKHLQKKDFKDWLIEIPEDIDEENRIVEIISSIDKAILATTEIIAKYRRIKTGLLHDLLRFGIDEKGNLRSEKTHGFKDSKLGRIPNDWDPSTIGKSCFVRNELRLPLSQEVRSKMQGDYRYYGPTGIFDYINEYRVEGKFVLIGEDGDHFLKFINQEQTILVEGQFNVNNHAHILEGSKDCLTEWIHLFFSHRDITLHLTRQGAGRYKLNKTALLNLDIAVPKIEEQKEILKRVDALKNKQEQDHLNLSKLKALKAGLMQDLLSGKVRVK